MLHTRTVISICVLALVAAPGCGSRGISKEAQPDHKASPGVSADAQPDHKSSHGIAANAQQDHKSGHGHSADVQPERKTGHGVAADTPPDRATGMAIGEIKSSRNIADGKNVSIEVLQPGEEKPRSYHVVYDPEKKAPNATVLAAVRAANVGDRVKFDWIQTGHGPAITKLEVVKKATN